MKKPARPGRQIMNESPGSPRPPHTQQASHILARRAGTTNPDTEIMKDLVRLEVLNPSRSWENGGFERPRVRIGDAAARSGERGGVGVERGALGAARGPRPVHRGGRGPQASRTARPAGGGGR